MTFAVTLPDWLGWALAIYGGLAAFGMGFAGVIMWHLRGQWA